ncbi:unnamed protein product [Oncorhynchus mykiss]|uniref:Uncharacterized protein n=1 Tax=Oncorhynchus mykiss TaxID=8022 RepID=A0A060VSE5_ONCMY|nr:unnamed protein product [Oncorhynchus mykiss]
MVNNAECTVPMLSVGMDTSETEGAESPPCQAEEISDQTGLPCEDSTTQDGAKGECSTESSPTISPPAARPVTQSTGTQASDQLDTDPSCDEPPAATSTPCVPAKASTSGAVVQKRDMSTSTEKLLTTAEPITPALSPSSAACRDQTSTQSAPAPPKPSNELTRDYIPKVGMTTYTIVPQKTLEKLRYFEVELTLESPYEALEKEVDIGSLELKEAEQLQVRTQQTELPSTVPREDYQSQQVHSTTTSESTVNGNLIESIHSPSTPTTIILARDDKIPSPASGGDQAGSIAEVKEMRIPPATKPKPGSFRLPQHKRTPGFYVTSAAVKCLSASPDAGQREAPGSLVATAAGQALQPVGGSFPPPPPPVQWDEETSEGVEVELRPKEEESRSVPPPRPSPVRAPPSPGLSLEKLRSFTAPKPYSPTTPSRFAQAVSSAVKRSQSLSTGSTSPSPCSPPFHPITSSFFVKDPKGTAGDKEPDVLPSSLSVPEPRKEE